MLGFKTRPKPGQWGKYVAVALTTSACSLQDYTYLGAGDPNTDTSDETSTNGSETNVPDAAPTTDVTDTVDIDASVPEGGIDDGGDATGPDLTDQTDETDTTMVDTSDTTAVDTTAPDAGDTDTTTDDLDAGPEPPLVVEGNLIPNSSFENPNSVWYGFGASYAINTSDRAHTGTKSLVSGNRKQGVWEGPALNLMPIVSAGESYTFQAWVQAESDTAQIGPVVKSNCRVTDDAGVVTPVEDLYTKLASTFATATQWHLIDVDIIVPDCELTIFDVYLEGPPVDALLYVDDVSLVPN